MPNPGYSPNQPEYYDFPNRYNILSDIIGGNLNDKKDEMVAFSSAENYRALATSRMPWVASSADNIQRAIEIVPELKVDKKQRAHRRQMSEQARQAILDVSVNRVMVTHGRKMTDRLDYVFLRRGTSEEVKKENDELELKIKGTPADRGRLLDERVRNSMELYQRILRGEVSEQELIENFEQIQMVQDVVFNAQNFKNAGKPDEKGKIYIQISPETMEILRDMERNSQAVCIFMNQIRVMANPNYEFLHLEYLVDSVKVSNDKFDELEEFASTPSKEDRRIPDDLIMDDSLWIIGTDRVVKRSIGRDNLMHKLTDDFPAEFENATIQFAGSNGKLNSMQYTTNHVDDDIERFMTKGYLLVTTPSGDAACYYLDNSTGRVRKANASEMLSDVAPDMKETLDMLEQANKGLFIGSREYSNALKGWERATKAAKDIGVPPSAKKVEQVTAQLQQVLAECEKYMNNKRTDPDDPDRDFDDIKQEMSDREWKRYAAIEKTATNCRKQLALLGLQRDAAAAELSLGKKAADASGKAELEYEETIIPESNVGNIADELREDINRSLKRMLNGEFDRSEAQEIFSNMVLLEVVRRGRTIRNGRMEAGPVEIALAEKPESMVRRMRDYPEVKTACENLTLEKLCQFVQEDRARDLAKQILQNAKEHNPDAKANDLQKQNEREVQKQAEGPKIVP